ncbi:hypothetical protein FKM82_007461, partial [Ascaphus truei]
MLWQRINQKILSNSRIMHEENQTTVSVFLLMGFPNLHSFSTLLFLIFLFVYIGTFAGNLLIIALVGTSQSLNSPMYFFLRQLSTCDILLITVIVPYMLCVILREGETISFFGCILQFELFGSLATTECLLLAVMSYDRYLAICYPLRYASIMDIRLCLHLAIWPWILGFGMMMVTAIQVSRLHFCGPNAIDHFFCDLAPLLELSCSDTFFVEAENLALGIPATFGPFLFITATYVYIFITILRIPTTTGRQKAFSTCSSHLTVVFLYYGTLVAAYLFLSKGHSLNVNKVLSLLYTVVTPLSNPIIYSLRSKEIKAALGKVINRYKG